MSVSYVRFSLAVLAAEHLGPRHCVYFYAAQYWVTHIEGHIPDGARVEYTTHAEPKLTPIVQNRSDWKEREIGKHHVPISYVPKFKIRHRKRKWRRK